MSPAAFTQSICFNVTQLYYITQNKERCVSYPRFFLVSQKCHSSHESGGEMEIFSISKYENKCIFCLLLEQDPNWASLYDILGGSMLLQHVISDLGMNPWN